jgi:hypothetical protein
MRELCAHLRLLDSPLTLARRRAGLDLEAGAERLGTATLKLARLESATRRLPPGTLRAMTRALAPRHPEQLSLFGEVPAQEARRAGG